MLLVIAIAEVLPWLATAVAVILTVALGLQCRSHDLSKKETCWWALVFVVIGILALFGRDLLLATL